MDTIEQNKQTVTAFIQRLFTEGDEAAVDKYLAEDFVDHDPPFGGPADREGMRVAQAVIRAGCPDWHSDLELLVGEGDLIVERFTASGTLRGPLMGVEPDGRALALRGVNIFRLREGLIVERWGRLDDLGLMRQLGLIPQP